MRRRRGKTCERGRSQNIAAAGKRPSAEKTPVEAIAKLMKLGRGSGAGASKHRQMDQPSTSSPREAKSAQDQVASATAPWSQNATSSDCKRDP
jgi:hypothetical protein